MPRIGHVKRIWATTTQTGSTYDGSQPDQDPDTWIDVLRIDQADFALRGAADGTTTTNAVSVFKWLDGYGRGEALAENANPKRATHPLAVYDQADPPSAQPQPGDDSAVTLYLVDGLTSALMGASDGVSGQATRTAFKNDPAAKTGRGTTAARVYNNDLGGDSSIDLTQGPVDWNAYAKALAAGAVDQSQYIDEEMVDTFRTALLGAADGTQGQGTANVMASKSIEQLADAGDRATPPFRLDPLQMIVNVSFKPGLAVEFKDGAA